MVKIKYPITTKDHQGTKIVIITQEQQKHLNSELIALQQCFNREIDKAELIQALDEQVDSYRQLSQETDSTLNKVSLMLTNREQAISEYKVQLNLKDQRAAILEGQLHRQKKQLLGWKIGTGVTIGVAVIAIPLILGLTL